EHRANPNRYPRGIAGIEQRRGNIHRYEALEGARVSRLGAHAIGHGRVITRVERADRQLVRPYGLERTRVSSRGAGEVLTAVRSLEVVALEMPTRSLIDEVTEVHRHQLVV